MEGLATLAYGFRYRGRSSSIRRSTQNIDTDDIFRGFVIPRWSLKSFDPSRGIQQFFIIVLLFAISLSFDVNLKCILGKEKNREETEIVEGAVVPQQ